MRRGRDACEASGRPQSWEAGPEPSFPETESSGLSPALSAGSPSLGAPRTRGDPSLATRAPACRAAAAGSRPTHQSAEAPRPPSGFLRWNREKAQLVMARDSCCTAIPRLGGREGEKQTLDNGMMEINSRLAGFVRKPAEGWPARTARRSGQAAGKPAAGPARAPQGCRGAGALHEGPGRPGGRQSSREPWARASEGSGPSGATGRALGLLTHSRRAVLRRGWSRLRKASSERLLAVRAAPGPGRGGLQPRADSEGPPSGCPGRARRRVGTGLRVTLASPHQHPRLPRTPARREDAAVVTAGTGLPRARQSARPQRRPR